MTHRQNLVFWDGLVQEHFTRIQGAGDDEDRHDLTWTGSWVTCDQCDDAQRAPTPSHHFLTRAKDKGNKLNQKLQGHKRGGFWFYTVVSSSNDNENNDNDDAQQKQQGDDLQHTLMTQHKLTRSSCGGGCDETDNDNIVLVVAKGKNEQLGPFIAAGYLKRYANTDLLGRGPGLLMARRYLPTYGDSRAEEWSLPELYNRISESLLARQQQQQQQQQSLGKSNWNVPLAPWRTLILHAEYLQALPLEPSTTANSKRQRRGDTVPHIIDEDEDEQQQQQQQQQEVLLPLKISHQTFDPTIVVTDQCGLLSNVQWLEQCYGCGKEILQDEDVCHNQVITYKSSEEDPYNHEPMEVYESIYCSPDCVKTNGAKAWAKAGQEWLARHHSTTWMMQGVVDARFWQVMSSDKAATKLLTDTGWEGPGSWTLHGEDFA